MSSVRDAILMGAAAASEYHEAFRTRATVADGARSIDIFGAITELEIPLEFAALKSLLGACIRVSDATVGIMITTLRDLHLQRFTAAHELGHFLLQHDGSLDREIRFPGQTEGRNSQEVEADAFAAEFLMPKWQIAAVAKRHGWWSVEQLSIPDVVYQLSLRLAVSYEATCWGLASQGCIERGVAERLTGLSPKVSKLRALRGLELDNPWADVWCLDRADEGTVLDGGPNDVFLVTLEEQATGGYTWDLSSARRLGCVVINDSSEFDKTLVGGSSKRRIALQVPNGIHELSLSYGRPFSPAAKVTKNFQVNLSTLGAQREGAYVSARSSTATLH